MDMLQYGDLIGVPFEYGGRGPDTYDCYGLVMECNRRAGIIIPDQRSPRDGTEAAELMGHVKTRWTPIWEKREANHFPSSADTPVGSTLLLNIKGLGCHVGYQVRPRQFIHTWEALGGVATERTSLWKMRILGVYKFDGKLSHQ